MHPAEQIAVDTWERLKLSRDLQVRLGEETLGDLPVAKDIFVTTPEEIGRRGHVVGGVLYAALGDGKTIYE